ncbi:Fe(2+) transporter [Podochytrium sp. JEL0797]|nr:Fe(2+) transporter [Podochytrium sp. JEL0797]
MSEAYHPPPTLPFFQDVTLSTGASTPPDHTSPKRISLSEMDTTKFAFFGSLMVVAMETALFPINTIQTIMMSHRTRHKPKPMWKTTFDIVKREGVLRLWRGIVPQTIGAFPGQACYYVAYETAHEALGRAVPSWEASSFVRGFLSGACADLAGGIFYVPADIVAQRLQIQNSHGMNFTRAVSTCAKKLCNKKVRSDSGEAILFPVMAKLKFENSEALAVPLSGGIAGFCALCANNPLEVMRVRLQVLESRNKQDAETIRRGYWHLGLQIYRREGVRAFYRGLTARLLTTLPGIVLAMTGYEYIKDDKRTASDDAALQVTALSPRTRAAVSTQRNTPRTTRNAAPHRVDLVLPVYEAPPPLRYSLRHPHPDPEVSPREKRSRINSAELFDGELSDCDIIASPQKKPQLARPLNLAAPQPPSNLDNLAPVPQLHQQQQHVLLIPPVTPSNVNHNTASTRFQKAGTPNDDIGGMSDANATPPTVGSGNQQHHHATAVQPQHPDESNVPTSVPSAKGFQEKAAAGKSKARKPTKKQLLAAEKLLASNGNLSISPIPSSLTTVSVPTRSSGRRETPSCSGAVGAAGVAAQSGFSSSVSISRSVNVVEASLQGEQDGIAGYHQFPQYGMSGAVVDPLHQGMAGWVSGGGFHQQYQQGGPSAMSPMGLPFEQQGYVPMQGAHGVFAHQPHLHQLPLGYPPHLNSPFGAPPVPYGAPWEHHPAAFAQSRAASGEEHVPSAAAINYPVQNMQKREELIKAHKRMNEPDEMGALPRMQDVHQRNGSSSHHRTVSAKVSAPATRSAAPKPHLATPTSIHPHSSSDAHSNNPTREYAMHHTTGDNPAPVHPTSMRASDEEPINQLAALQAEVIRMREEAKANKDVVEKLGAEKLEAERRRVEQVEEGRREADRRVAEAVGASQVEAARKLAESEEKAKRDLEEAVRLREELEAKAVRDLEEAEKQRVGVEQQAVRDREKAAKERVELEEKAEREREKTARALAELEKAERDQEEAVRKRAAWEEQAIRNHENTVRALKAESQAELEKLVTERHKLGERLEEMELLKQERERQLEEAERARDAMKADSQAKQEGLEENARVLEKLKNELEENAHELEAVEKERVTVEEQLRVSREQQRRLQQQAVECDLFCVSPYRDKVNMELQNAQPPPPPPTPMTITFPPIRSNHATTFRPYLPFGHVDNQRCCWLCGGRHRDCICRVGTAKASGLLAEMRESLKKCSFCEGEVSMKTGFCESKCFLTNRSVMFKRQRRERDIRRATHCGICGEKFVRHFLCATECMEYVDMEVAEFTVLRYRRLTDLLNHPGCF